MIRIRNKRNRISLLRFILFACAIFAMIGCFSVAVYANTRTERVRVGYYENEVFQEGAGEGKVKSGYAYEYYRKLSEYTGWEYEYVYGEFSDLYQMLLDGEIDLLAGLAMREDRTGIIGYPDAIMGNESYYLPLFCFSNFLCCLDFCFLWLHNTITIWKKQLIQKRICCTGSKSFYRL